MTRQPHHDLSRRERQIMDILYSQGRATASDVQSALPDPPSYSAVRAMLRILEDKGHIRHEQDGPRYLYRPTVARDNAKRSALLDDSSSRLSEAELERLARLIDRARRNGA